MRRLKARGWSVAVMAVAATGLAACGSSSSTSKSSSATAASASSTTVGSTQITSLTVATLPVVDNVVIWEAVSEGFFTKHGLNVSYKNLSGGGPATINAVQSGSVQFAQFSSPVFMIAAGQGIPITSVAEMDEFPATNSPEGIFVKSSSSIQSVADLKGKTIGVNSLTSLEAVRLETEALPAAHLTLSDVHLVPIPFPQMQEALSTGEVQAVIPFDPFTTRLRQSSGFRELTNFHQYIPAGGLSLGVIAAEKSYVTSHPQVVSEFDAAIAQSISFIQANQQQAAALASKVLGLPESITLTALGNIKLVSGGTQDLTTYNNMVTALKSVKLVPSTFNVANYISK